jgi:hypothetical protein
MAWQVVSESVLPKCVTAAPRSRRRATAVRCTDAATASSHRSTNGRPERRAAAPRRHARVLDTFVGREHAMERLRHGLEAACRSGRIFLLTGEPGIGKSRTADEFALEARRDATVLIGRAYEDQGAPAFWPWIQVLQALVQEADLRTIAADAGPGAAEIVELLPELRERVRAMPAASATASDAARFRLFDSVTLFLKRVAARRPLLVVLDDLHWADEASLRLLRFLAAALTDARLLVLATYRDVQCGAVPARRGVARWPASPPASASLYAARSPIRPRSFAECWAASRRKRPGDQEMTEGNPSSSESPESWPARAARRTSPRLALPQSVRGRSGAA